MERQADRDCCECGEPNGFALRHGAAAMQAGPYGLLCDECWELDCDQTDTDGGAS